MVTTTDPARPRGLLNERERRYLLGQADIEPQSQAERDIRATIRSRLRHSLYDQALLFSHLEDRDIEQVFRTDAENIAELQTAIEETLGFLYRATVDFHPPFHQLTQEGIKRAEQTHFNRYVKVTVDVEPVEPVDSAVIREKMDGEHAQRLTPEESLWIAETVVASEEFSFTDLDAANEKLRRKQAGFDIEDTSAE